MSESTVDVLPELKQIVGALLFAAREPLSIKRIRKAMIETGNGFGGPYEQYAKATDEQIKGALEELQEEFEKAKLGLGVAKVAEAYRLQNDAACGPFVRALLEKNQTMRLSKPALETLAIVAYRQPCLRSEIEEVRGVAVDAVLRRLIDMQLVRVVRRSELPGRPWLFGTTQSFWSISASIPSTICRAARSLSAPYRQRIDGKAPKPSRKWKRNSTKAGMKRMQLKKNRLRPLTRKSMLRKNPRWLKKQGKNKHQGTKDSKDGMENISL